MATLSIERATSGYTAAITDTTSTTVIAAPGAGRRLVITDVLVTNGHATQGTRVDLLDGATVRFTGFAKSDGGGFNLKLEAPIVCAANAAFKAQCGTTGSSVYVSASGYIDTAV